MYQSMSRICRTVEFGDLMSDLILDLAVYDHENISKIIFLCIRVSIIWKEWCAFAPVKIRLCKQGSHALKSRPIL